MVILMKFTTKYEHAELFRNGKLYMNALDYFWKNGFKAQKDILEGVIASVKPKDFPPGFDKEFIDVQCADFRLQACGYAYCNVFCMSQITATPDASGNLYITYPKDMNEFGDYAIIVDNQQEFYRRINQAASMCDFRYLCGHVNYHELKFNGGDITAKHDMLLRTSTPLDITEFLKGEYRRYDSFDKSNKYITQNEWRLSLYRGVKDVNPYTFDLEIDLHDITHVVKTSDLNIQREIQNSRFLKNSIDCYYGNVSRKELRELFYKLGDYNGWLFSLIG